MFYNYSNGDLILNKRIKANNKMSHLRWIIFFINLLVIRKLEGRNFSRITKGIVSLAVLSSRQHSNLKLVLYKKK